MECGQVETFNVTGNVELFPQPGGWHYIVVPKTISDKLSAFADRGVIAIRATAGEVSWNTSLLPMGDGRHFIALNARVRQANSIEIGDIVTVRFKRRER